MDLILRTIFILLSAVLVYGQLSDKVECTHEMNDERDRLINQNMCARPRPVFIDLRHTIASEEIHPSKIWIKRCVGFCDNINPDSRCMPNTTVTREIIVKVVNLRTMKESCMVKYVDEDESCLSCEDSGRRFNKPASIDYRGL